MHEARRILVDVFYMSDYIKFVTEVCLRLVKRIWQNILKGNEEFFNFFIN